MEKKEQLRQLVISAWKDGNTQYNPNKGSIDYDADIEVFLENFQYKIDELCEGETSEREQANDNIPLVNVSALQALYEKRLEYEYQIESHQEGSKERIEIEAKFNAIYEAECIVKEYSR